MSNTKSIVQDNIVLDSGNIPYVTAAAGNNGIMSYIRCPKEWVDKGNCIMIGGKTLTFSYQEYDFCSNDSHNIALYLKDRNMATKKHYLFLIAALKSSLQNRYSWGNSISMKKIKKETVFLPVKSNQIDYAFMDEVIAELEAERVQELAAYLEAAGLTDYTLTKKEKDILGGNICPNKWGKVPFISIFNQIHQGRCLKKEDQLPGAIPFVMSGTTNNGVVGYISNPVASFPANSITMDIFGNTFYRNYEFGAGDDTGVYWSDKVSYSLGTMLFFTTVMRKAVEGRFSYGKKLRSSKSLEIKMYVPINNNELDYDYMETLISAVQKLVIRDVVIYTQRKLEITKHIVFAER